MRRNIAAAFVDAKAAYRVIDESSILPIASEVEGHAIQNAISDADNIGANGAKAHLLKAAEALRSSRWADSARESIHAVESVAVQLAPSTNTLGDALTALEKGGHMHGALKKGVSALYGYASDEKGVRHALVLQDTANVDEADAMFMLGACASCVSFLLARGRAANII